jgi:hypothetical protein
MAPNRVAPGLPIKQKEEKQMARIFKCTDRIQHIIDCGVDGKVTLFLQPLTAQDKARIADIKKDINGVKVPDSWEMSMESIRRSLKDVKGLFYDDGQKKPFALKFDEQGRVSDESLTELLNTQITNELVAGCMQMVTGVQSEVCDLQDRKLEHVEVVFPKDSLPNG